MKKGDQRAETVRIAWENCVAQTGRAPTMQELADASKLKSKASVHGYKMRLIHEGRIEDTTTHRTIYKLHKEVLQLRQELEHCRGLA